MKYGKLNIVLILFLSLFMTTLLQARPQAAASADFAEKQAAWQKHQELVSVSPYAGLEWRSVGPVVQGGRLVDMEVVPGQPYTFYAAYASGGLWKTTNNGHTFEPLFDQQSTMIMGDIVPLMGAWGSIARMTVVRAGLTWVLVIPTGSAVF